MWYFLHYEHITTVPHSEREEVDKIHTMTKITEPRNSADTPQQDEIHESQNFEEEIAFSISPL